jgi:membrane protease YdiL (CAAX protease family)
VNNSTLEPSAHWPTVWPKTSFRPGPTALVVLAILAASAIVLVAGIAWVYASNPTVLQTRAVPVVPAVVIQLVLEAIVVAILLVALPRVSGFSLRELGFRALTGGELLTALGGALAMLILVQGSSSAIESALHVHHEQDVVALFKQLRGAGVLLFFTVFAAVIAPIAEEMVFRVFLFNIAQRYGGFWVGAIVSGVCFGAVHGDLYAFVPLAAGGVLLCYLYYRTGNAYVSMIAHGLFNAVTLLALLAVPKLAQ